MVNPVQRIPVRFQGLPAEVEDLTWGQRAIWGAMVAQQSWLPIPLVRELAPGTTVEDVVAQLRYCLDRHDSFRTRLTFDQAGEPRQLLASAGELVVEVFEAGTAEPAALAGQLRDQYLTQDFDFARDWPVRTGVVLQRGTPTHLVSLYCHLMLDGAALLALLADLARPAGDRRGAREEPAGLRPVELARWERANAGQRASAASLRHWAGLLRQLPARQLPARQLPARQLPARANPGEAAPQHPRYWRAAFQSRAMHLALQVVSHRLRASTAALLAVFAVAFGRVTGGSPVTAQVVVGNRFRPHLASVFAPVNQPGLWAVDVAGATFAEVLGQARRRAMSAYKHAYYDPREHRELLARLAEERGEDIDIGCFVNDRRLTTGAELAGGHPTAAQVAAARRQTTFAWQVRTDTPNERLFLHVEDDPGVISLTAWIDTQAIAPADLAAILYEMEAAAITAAFDPAAPTGVETARQPVRSGST